MLNVDTDTMYKNMTWYDRVHSIIILVRDKVNDLARGCVRW